MFVPHLVAATHRQRSRDGRPPDVRRRGKVAASIAVAAVFGGLAPALGALLEGVHGGASAAGIIIGLLSGGLGFGLAKLVGRQR